jgi:S-formylglutathione hydrolase FrmB
MRAALVVALGALACANGAPPAAPSEPAPAPAPAVTAKGRVVNDHFASAALGVDKDVVVYLPAGYDAAPDRRWPVFYYLHGLGGDETNWTQRGKLDETADQVGVAAIIVMPDGDDSFYADARAADVDYDKCLADGTGLLSPERPSKRKQCVRKRLYETYITRDLVAWVDRTYRTIAKREGRGIAGLSMGGFGALELGMRHPELFAAAASHSGVDAVLYHGPDPYAKGRVVLLEDPTQWGGSLGPFGRWVRDIFGPELANWKAHDPAALAAQLVPGHPAIYLDCGTEDEFRLHNGMQYLHDLLVDRKIDHEYYLGPGHHDFGFWGARLPNSLAFLRAHTAPPT